MDQFELVCASPQMRRVAETVRMSRGRPLLLTGETGVGKDILARWAHTISPFAEGPFVPINCAAIQESLWESEIFGHAKGAFTGALRNKPGQIEQAEEGTLFLNEIGEMPLPMQAKLLTFLDTGEFQRVGETESIRVETRVIAATNRNLEAAVEAGGFRRDLYYRLAAVRVHIPPLRERSADVLALAALCLRELNRERDARRIALTDSTRQMLVSGRWKGNVRELYSAMETAFERCLKEGGARLKPEHFDVDVSEPPSGSGAMRSADPSRLGRSESDEAATLKAPWDVGGAGGGSQPLAPIFTSSERSILDDPEALRSFLNQIKAPSGRWNISTAHRLLAERGEIKIGRRAFAQRIKQIFPDEESS